MSDFKTKMHEIRFPLGLRPDSASPDSLAVFKGPTSGLLVREGEEGKVKGEGCKGDLAHPKILSYMPPS